MEEKEFRHDLIEAFVLKSSVKQQVYENIKQTFDLLKKVLKQLEEEYTSMVDNRLSANVLPKYNKRGPFEVEFKVGGELLIFSMHSNVFEFHDEHPIWETPYLGEDSLRGYCGIISIYNFLSDSFKYNRDDDLGYLIARIFVNKDNHFFVEGKQQDKEQIHNFGRDAVSPGLLRQIIETAVQFCIEFDLFVPPYENVKTATVNQMKQKVSHSKMITGKRLGFTFNTDDI